MPRYKKKLIQRIEEDGKLEAGTEERKIEFKKVMGANAAEDKKQRR